MKLGVFATHPIQYQIPLWQGLSDAQGLDVEVFYISEPAAQGNVDPGFGTEVSWDIPLYEGYKHRFLSSRPIHEVNSFSIPNLKKFLAREKFDIVLLHGYTHVFARQLIRNAKKYGFKVILRGEFTDMPRRSMGWKNIARQLYLKWFYQYIDHFCPIGIDAVEHLQRRGIANERMTLTPYSVDDRLFKNQNDKLDKGVCRAELDITTNQCVFLFSGKMISRKQPLLLADAILSIMDEYPQLVLIYLGSGEEFQELKSKLEPSFGNRFIAPGFVNQSKLGLYFKAADVFVQPSQYDTWGLVVNEAMHFGLPCIVSDRVGSRRDLLIPGKTGMVFHFLSKEELINCLRHFLDNPKETKSMGENAQKHIRGFTIDTTLKGLLDAIKTTLGANARA